MVEQGFAIGNGLTNPLIQYKGLPDYALEHKLISQSYYNNMQDTVTECEDAIKACGKSSVPNSLDLTIFNTQFQEKENRKEKIQKKNFLMPLRMILMIPPLFPKIQELIIPQFFLSTN